MGGAERTARKRKQQQTAGARAVAQARGGSSSKKGIIAVIGVVVLAALVIGGVLLINNSKNATEGKGIPVQQPLTALPEAREGVTVVVGKPEAKATIDVYADFLCPACGQFHKAYGKQLEEQAAAGKVRVRYHMVPMLNRYSNPPGYSLDSANAALCAADEGKFLAFHDSLFGSQPEEGTRGYDKGQLIQLGKDLGIADPAFESCVNSGTYNQQLTTEFDKISKDPALQRDLGRGPGFSTPTVTANGQIVDVTDKDWLGKVVAAQG